MAQAASHFPQQPDYLGGGLVNLMQSLVLGRGGTAVEPYVPTPLLPVAEVAAARHVVLIVLDGLGSHYLAQHGAQGPLAAHLRGELTTVFPSTTAATITTLVTATAPQQHAVTGWFMYLRELGTVAAILPFRPRWSDVPFDKSGVSAEGLIAAPSLFPRLAVSSYFLVPQAIVDSSFSRAAARGAQRVGYQGMGGCCQTVSNLIGASGADRCFIYVYWPEFDALSHKYGNASAEALEQFRAIESTFAQLQERLRGSGTMVVAIADHGFIDTSPAETVQLADHPALHEALVLPLCGEPRAAYCYVRPDRARAFEHYVQTQLSAVCELIPSAELVRRGFFGLGPPAPALGDRIGDYVLLLKDHYTLRDRVLGERPYDPIGVHGGASTDEMFVPLLVAGP
ncbi:MAG: alkaline phosphatase family protein [Proteobacteria bacterium]|nr:alkaline phosphatase family protein [Pseudomonadota bacterium]